MSIERGYPGGYSEEASPDTHTLPIPRALDAADKQLATLEERLSVLVDRLRPICSPLETKRARENDAPIESGSQLTERLRRLEMHLAIAQNTVAELVASLEV